MAALRPPSLDDLGLIEAIRAVARQLTAAAGICLEADLPDSFPILSDDLEIVLLRIAQEAIANACKHSNASLVRVVLTLDRGEAVLRISDDGDGFDLRAQAPPAAGHHLGIVSMRERAAMVGASFDLRSRPGRGTKLEIGVPLEPAEEPAPPASTRGVARDG